MARTSEACEDAGEGIRGCVSSAAGDISVKGDEEEEEEVERTGRRCCRVALTTGNVDLPRLFRRGKCFLFSGFAWRL